MYNVHVYASYLYVLHIWILSPVVQWIDPTDIALQSIACDKCNLWYHYGCVEIKGDEPFLFKKNSRWVCQTCKPTAKSKGKGKGKGKGKK